MEDPGVEELSIEDTDTKELSLEYSDVEEEAVTLLLTLLLLTSPVFSRLHPVNIIVITADIITAIIKSLLVFFIVFLLFSFKK
jgi:hypothetical protein